MGRAVAPQWVQNINTVCIVIGGPLLASLFTRWRARGWPVDIPQQFCDVPRADGSGLSGAAGGHPAGRTRRRARADFFWLFISYVLQSVGELLISPVGYAMIGASRRRQYQGVMMGSWMLVTGLASLFAGDFSGVVVAASGRLAADDESRQYATLFTQLARGQPGHRRDAVRVEAVAAAAHRRAGCGQHAAAALNIGRLMSTRRWVVPASFFSMVLGLCGLGTDWRAATKLWGAPAWIGEAVMTVAGSVWLLLAVLYALKWWRDGDAARAEIAHPIQCCFVALVPVTAMLVGIAVLPHSRPAALVLCCVGSVASLVFAAWRHGGLWRGDRSVNATTPALYLPIVATNLVSAMAAGALGWPELGQLFLGAGVLAWLTLESVIVSRLLMAEPMALPLRPTLGIQPAPPAVTLLAYTAVTTGPPDLIAHGLLGYAIVQALIVARLLPWIRQPFTPGYWAFTFGVTAIASATMRYAERGGDWVFTALAPVLFVVANVVVVGLFIATVWAALRGRLLPR